MIGTSVRKPAWIRQVEAAGLKGSVPTVWVMEGLLVYVEPHIVERILQQLNNACPVGSFLMASVISESQLNMRSSGPVRDKWKWGCPENAEEVRSHFGHRL